MEVIEALKNFWEHPIGRRFKEEEEAERLAKRKAAAAEIAAANEEAETVLPGLRAKLAEAEDKLTAHDQRRQEVVAKVQEARAALWSAEQPLDGRRSRAEAVLYDTAPSELAEGQEFFRSRIDELRRKPANVQQRKGGKDLLHERVEMVTFTNAPAINEALTFCRACVSELEQMKFEATPDIGRIAEMRRSIPDVETLTKISSDKAIAGSKGMSVEIKLACMASEREHRKEVLEKKGDKLMRRR